MFRRECIILYAGLRKRDIGYEAKTVNFTTIHWGVLRQWQQDESVRQGHAMRVSIQNEVRILKCSP